MRTESRLRCYARGAMLGSLLVGLVAMAMGNLALAGEIISVTVDFDPQEVPLNIGDVIHFSVVTDGPGEVTVDIANVHQGISLRDDGLEGDRVRGDQNYELDYVIHPGDTIAEGPVLAHFVGADGQRVDSLATNPGLPRLTIDATRPQITNDGMVPNPFNPTDGPAYLRYTLTEKASVTIEISQEDGTLVRTLGLPSGQAGENQATWDGTNDQGRLVLDGQYQYQVQALDPAGNTANVVSGGVILSTIRFQIDQAIVAPNPFFPDGNNVDDGTRITFSLSLFATPEQLQVIGMGTQNFLTADLTDDGEPTPFALIGITFLDATGQMVHAMSHDLSPGADTDFAPSGWPNRRPPEETPPGSGNFLGGALPDYGDDVDSNDWDSLVPLNGPFSAGDDTHYEATFSVQWQPDETIASGTYLINIEAELAGRTWEFVDHLREQDRITGEMWHALPTHHFGLRARQRTQFVTIDRQTVLTPDDDPPQIASTNPSDGLVIDPAQREVTEISVVLEDDADGSGVDLAASRLSLLNPLGNQVKGQLQPFGLNTLKLLLDSPLAASGEYTVSVIAIDKRGNQSEPLERGFIIQDTSAPVIVPNTLVPAPTEAAYTTPIQEIQAVLSDGETGTGVDIEKSALLVKNSTNVTIQGELVADSQTNLLRYQLTEPLPSDDYTIVVIAVDKAGEQAIYTEQFTVDLRQNIEIREGETRYAVVHAGTQATSPSGTQLSAISVTATQTFPQLLPELHVLGQAAAFVPNGIEFSDAIQIELGYPAGSLPADADRSAIKLYAYDEIDGNVSWREISNAVHAEDKPLLVARTTRLAAYYVVAQLQDASAVLARDVRASRERFWPERGESVTFTFPNTANDVYVEVYNVGGELARSLRSSTNVVSWDGKNQQGHTLHQGIFICRLRYIERGQFQIQHKLIALLR